MPSRTRIIKLYIWRILKPKSCENKNILRELNFRIVYFWDESLHGQRQQEILKRLTMENRLFSMNLTWIAKIHADDSPKTDLIRTVVNHQS